MANQDRQTIIALLMPQADDGRVFNDTETGVRAQMALQLTNWCQFSISETSFLYDRAVLERIDRLVLDIGLFTLYKIVYLLIRHNERSRALSLHRC